MRSCCLGLQALPALAHFGFPGTPSPSCVTCDSTRLLAGTARRLPFAHSQALFRTPAAPCPPHECTHAPAHTRMHTPPTPDTPSRIVHRCGEEILRQELPAKREVVVKLALTPTQHAVYQRYITVGGMAGTAGLGVWSRVGARFGAFVLGCAQPARPGSTAYPRRMRRPSPGLPVSYP